MILIDKDTVLTADLITSYIQTFNTTDRLKYQKYFDYYKGNQAIMLKTVTDTSKPCNKIVTNYCYNIVNNYLGYLTGKQITYTSQSDITDIQDILNYNDVKTADSDLLKNALIYGKAFEVQYIDEDIKQRFKVLDTRECIPVYDNTINQNLLYIIRYYLIDSTDTSKGYYIELYNNKSIATYKCNDSFANLMLVSDTPHYFKQVPITEFVLNSDYESIFDKIITLQDAYNNLLSAEVDDFEAFCDAYMVLKGVNAYAEDFVDMKENRILLLDDTSSAEYLTKSVSDTQIQNMLTNINDTIHKIANSPDFNDDKFMAQSGVAMKFKLTGMENMASNIEANMTKAIQKRIELICEVLSMTGESIWRDINIIFTRNLPSNDVEVANMINTLRGLVSDETLISLLPFINDAKEEMDKVNLQKAENMAMYGFNTANTDSNIDTTKAGE